MSALLSNQVLVPIGLHRNAESCGRLVTVFPNQPDWKVMLQHPGAFGARRTGLTEEPSEYLRVSIDGRYKPDHHRS